MAAAISGALSDQSPRERRKQLRREASLRTTDEGKQHDMSTSERLAAVCDLIWRRRQGQRPDASRPAPDESLSGEDARRVARVVVRLEDLAPLWNQLPAGGELAFTWPSVVPRAPGRRAERRVV